MTSAVASVNIAGIVQLFIPSGSLQVIRIEQCYGFASLLLLYAALLASPLIQAYPRLPLKNEYLHARRAIGVSSFYFACLHGYITFFGQLGGFSGIKYYNQTYSIAVILGAAALGVLCLLTITSLDWAVSTLGFKNWKLLHRLVYLGGIALLVHIALIGPHYSGFGFMSALTAVGILFLVYLEVIRFTGTMAGKRRLR